VVEDVNVNVMLCGAAAAGKAAIKSGDKRICKDEATPQAQELRGAPSLEKTTIHHFSR
jgi:hypothetical protein